GVSNGTDAGNRYPPRHWCAGTRSVVAVSGRGGGPVIAGRFAGRLAGGGVVVRTVAVDEHALCVSPGHQLNCPCVFGAGRRGIRVFSRPPRRAPESYRRTAHLISRTADVISGAG